MRGIALAIMGFTLVLVGAGHRTTTGRLSTVLVADTVLAGHHFHAEARVDPIPAGFPWTKMMFGCYWEGAAAYVRDVTIRDGESPIGVQLSGYSDLGNPQRMAFKEHAGGALLMMEGNDKQESFGNPWTAEFTIENDDVVRRRLWVTSFPGEGSEETIYQPDDD